MNEEEIRKNKSEMLLEKLGSGYLPSLPLIETEDKAQLRKPIEVGERIICLLAVAAAADGLDKKRIIDWMKNESLLSKLSPHENSYLNKYENDENERIQFHWRSECIWILLWAANKVERNLPTEQCDIQEIVKHIPPFESDTSEFINSIKLRPKSEILDLSDFIYRAHWATRQNSMDVSIEIGELNADVIQEWHQAINWLTFYEGIDNWDEVTTDT